MSLRTLLRLVLCFAVIILGLRRFAHESSAWLIVSIVLALVLLLVLITSAFRKPHNPRDDVPKRPLGLDS
jgi:hypothetical protein